ncbi:uncharacterized protein LOC114390464 [Glycine soja]|uniref:Uncharacterized protein n=1 Tax=Glycine soja TaxID=3848 RepID=A0A445GG53_GLYSO|nr:uncharacterized protein LOC114390464 [Glycine soja]RZB60195.1 hypothetical protein D0Y65_043109 [Glycine soja]
MTLDEFFFFNLSLMIKLQLATQRMGISKAQRNLRILNMTSENVDWKLRVGLEFESIEYLETIGVFCNRVPRRRSSPIGFEIFGGYFVVVAAKGITRLSSTHLQLWRIVKQSKKRWF